MPEQQGLDDACRLVPAAQPNDFRWRTAYGKQSCEIPIERRQRKAETRRIFPDREVVGLVETEEANVARAR